MKYYRTYRRSNGEEWHGIEFRTEAELEAFITMRAPLVTEAMPPPAIHEELRAPGRPSHDDRIADAVHTLAPQLKQLLNTERARLIRRHIAHSTSEQGEVPGHSTIMKFLASQKWSQKDSSARISRNRRK